MFNYAWHIGSYRKYSSNVVKSCHGHQYYSTRKVFAHVLIVTSVYTRLQYFVTLDGGGGERLSTFPDITNNKYDGFHSRISIIGGAITPLYTVLLLTDKGC